MTLRDITPWYGARGSEAAETTDPFRRLQDDMERMFATFRAGPQWGPAFGLRGTDGVAAPTLDVSEDNGAIEVTVDVPGVDSKDLKVSIENGILTVSGTREDEMAEGGEDKNYHRVEFYRGDFLPRVALPAGIDDGAVDARHCKGVLTIKIPKTAAAQASQKQIEIKAEA